MQNLNAQHEPTESEFILTGSSGLQRVHTHITD